MTFTLDLAVIEECAGKLLYTYNVCKPYLWGLLFVPVYTYTDTSASRCRRMCMNWFRENHPNDELEWTKR